MSVVEHRDPGDLGQLLAEQQARIAQLEERDTGTGWVDWNPGVQATGGGVTRGTGYKFTGRYNITADGTVEGSVTMRFGNMNRGSGVYRFILPVPGVNHDRTGFTPIGGAGCVGVGLEHCLVEPHLCGFTGFKSNHHAVLVPQGGLYVTDDFPFPGEDIDNIHFTFRYEWAT